MEWDSPWGWQLGFQLNTAIAPVGCGNLYLLSPAEKEEALTPLILHPSGHQSC